MTTPAKDARFRKQLAKLKASRRAPDKVKVPARERIRGGEPPLCGGGERATCPNR
jgi:hypothetical protein